MNAEIAEQGVARYYTATSWHCLFGGYGTYLDEIRLKPSEPQLAIADLDWVEKFVAGCSKNFPGHDAALSILRQL